MKDPLTKEEREKVERVARQVPIDLAHGERGYFTPTERALIRDAVRPHTPLDPLWPYK